jgi:hypothetical protein
LLRQEGLENGKPRVEDCFGRAWVHVWPKREEAERFATRLRGETGNGEWEVYDLGPPRMQALEADEHAGPVVILIGRRESDGTSYDLHPNSVDRVREAFPQASLHPSAFIANDTPRRDKASHRPDYDQVAALLTGLSREQLLTLGGYRIVDPLTDLMLYKAAPTDE